MGTFPPKCTSLVPGRLDLLVVNEVRVFKVAAVVRHRGGVQEHVSVFFGLELEN